ncbi:MAG: hydrogenase iron-sulfur subunit [Clostridiales bacterium]|nr:hydrogenase iron-sulfur subunit [Clostridiales bacterium]
MKKPVMVVGGGIAGIQAAADLAEMGIPVFLLESSPSIGGRMAQLDKTFPTNDCSACILAPKVTDCYNHPLVKTFTLSDLEEVRGEAPNFTAVVRKRPRYIDEEKCTGCGDCSSVCPVSVKSEFDMGIGKRKAVYKPYAQAVPNKAVIDNSACRHCKLCEKACRSKAVCYDQEEEVFEIPVSAVVLAPGYDVSSEIPAELGYSKYADVVTSLEYERILSASGPFAGHVQRPSDGKPPKRLAFIQCVGSRDHQCSADYCSAVCCMYAVKEAEITKEHLPEAEGVDIYYMDMRAYGKDFDKYVDSAKAKYGINFIRSRVAETDRDEATGNILLKHADTGGNVHKSEYDMVVLSVGIVPKEENIKLCSRLKVKTDRYGFIWTGEMSAPESSREGIMACGAATGPKDIPETVIEASAAAAAAAKAASKTEVDLFKSYPAFFTEEPMAQVRDVSKEPIRAGVFVCSCGVNIGGYLSVGEVVEYAKSLPFVTFAGEGLYTCSVDFQTVIIDKIKEYGLNRIVVASCTPRTHEPLFQGVLQKAGLNPYLLTMANIRDQCSWVHMEDANAATFKAKELVRMAVGKAVYAKQLSKKKLDVNKAALVIGGGAAGLSSALELSGMGYSVHIVEKTGELGGNAKSLSATMFGRPVGNYLADFIRDAAEDPNITVHLNSKIKDITGFVGNFTTRIEALGSAGVSTEGSPPAECTTMIEHGVVVVAVGASEKKPDAYLYGKSPNVETQLKFEERLKNGDSCLSGVKDVVMILCAGSRDENNPYCSRVCCNQSIKNAIAIKEYNSDINVTVLYREIRSYGLSETFYRRARQKGVQFVRFEDDEKPVVAQKEGFVQVSAIDPLLSRDVAYRADLLLLASAIEPDREGNKTIAQMLKVPMTQEGFFLEAHVKLRPVDFATEGVYLCGLAHNPKNLRESIVQGKAAAARAGTVISKDFIEAEGAIAAIDMDLCVGCGECERVCAYKAITLEEVQARGKAAKKAVLNDVLCKGCGTCAANCRCGAIDVGGFSDMQVINEIEYLLRGDVEAKQGWEPKIIAFLCNWCSYAGADLAGTGRMQYPPNIRVIRVPCSGRINPAYIIKALAEGADGVMVSGCHPGDCHYLTGNMYARRRFTVLKKLLETAGIDPNRVHFTWVSASEGGRFAEVVKEVTDKVGKLGQVRADGQLSPPAGES